MPYISFPAKPSYLLTCVKLKRRGDQDNPPGCGWSGKFYFDTELPPYCPKCFFRHPYPNHGDRFLIESITLLEKKAG